MGKLTKGKFTKTDLEEILRVAKIVRPTYDDMNSIYQLYKKYVDPKAGMFTTHCNGCHRSIQNYFNSLMKWFSINRGQFPN